MIPIPFTTINWDLIPKVAYAGETGTAFWQTLQYDNLRVRMVTYSENYTADHWCTKGHIVHCIEGSFVSELESGESFKLNAGETYIVTDEESSHKSISANGVKLLIIDGSFLKK
jgi:hypothetical protein